MRLLVAYARRFTHPRPYKLIDLAEAAGMSISGVRIAYDNDELDRLAEMLGRAPVPPPGGEGSRRSGTCAPRRSSGPGMPPSSRHDDQRWRSSRG